MTPWCGELIKVAWRTVARALERAEKAGLTFNPEKYVFGVCESTFLRDMINADCVLLSPELIESI